MAALEDKELAQEWVKNNTDESPNSFRGEELQEAFLAGLEASKPKWHKVADGDLPKVHSTVLDENGNKVVYIGGGEWEAFSEYYERYVGIGNPFAWCEIPQYINEE